MPPVAADTWRVFQTKDVTASDLDEVLTALPSGFAVGVLDQARLVVGPTGCTVLMAESTGASPEVASSELAQTTRLNLADHLSWVPFVDALVITSENNMGSIVSVELDMLIPLLVDGPTMLDEETIACLTGLVAERRLKPEWHFS